MESGDRNADKYNIWALDWYRMDWVFVDCDIRGGIGAYFEHDGCYGGDRLEYKSDTVALLANLKHECRRLCEYPDFVIDDGNAQQRGCGGGDGRDVAGWSGSCPGLAAGWRHGDDVGHRAIEQWRGGDIMVADIRAKLPDCGGWRRHT